jgi:hydroxyacylglutathione hydrolase
MLTIHNLWGQALNEPFARMSRGECIHVNLQLQRLQVGPWPMNCYLIRCSATGQTAVVDPGADAEIILDALGQATVRYILLTHGHPDHVGALEAVRQATGAPVAIHPADAEAFDLEADLDLTDGMEVRVGDGCVTAVHVPGHTPGSTCLGLDGLSSGRVLVGDAIFPGGPGHTASPEALAQSLASLGRTVFAWPDGTELYPGHGDHTTVGAERAAFEQFIAAGPPPGLYGDVIWR